MHDVRRLGTVHADRLICCVTRFCSRKRVRFLITYSSYFVMLRCNLRIIHWHPVAGGVCCIKVRCQCMTTESVGYQFQFKRSSSLDGLRFRYRVLERFPSGTFAQLPSLVPVDLRYAGVLKLHSLMVFVCIWIVYV